MASRGAARALARQALAADGSVRDEVAAAVLAELSRADLKAFLAALRREVSRRTVGLSVAGSAETARAAAAGFYPGRGVAVAAAPALGAGVRLTDGDDIVDATVDGIIRNIIAELGST